MGGNRPGGSCPTEAVVQGAVVRGQLSGGGQLFGYQLYINGIRYHACIIKSSIELVLKLYTTVEFLAIVLLSGVSYMFRCLG